MSGLVYLIDRMLRVPMSQEAYCQEVEGIKLLAEKNGYLKKTVDRLINKRLKKWYGEPTTVSKDLAPNQWCTIPYVGPLSDRLGRKLRRQGVQVAFKSGSSLRSQLCKVKDTVDVLDQSGVYRLNCNSCDASYVGQTGRKLRTRCYEHLTYSTSEMFCHLEEEDHDKKATKVQLLHNVKKGLKMNIMEDIEIGVDSLSNSENKNRRTNTWRLKYTSAEDLSPLLQFKRPEGSLEYSRLA